MAIFCDLRNANVSVLEGIANTEEGEITVVEIYHEVGGEKILVATLSQGHPLDGDVGVVEFDADNQEGIPSIERLWSDIESEME